MEPHMMDGAGVAIGDSVFDTALGTGKVEELLLDNRIIVRFYPSNRRAAYGTSGVAHGKQFRTLYWHDPVLFIPLKNEPKWQQMKRIFMSIAAELRGTGL